jgi:hypothetical protein
MFRQRTHTDGSPAPHIAEALIMRHPATRRRDAPSPRQVTDESSLGCATRSAQLRSKAAAPHCGKCHSYSAMNHSTPHVSTLKRLRTSFVTRSALTRRKLLSAHLHMLGSIS